VGHSANWLNSVAVLLAAYIHCIHGHDDLLNQQIDQVLEPLRTTWSVPVRRKTAVCADRAITRKAAVTRTARRPLDDRGRRPLYVRGFPARPADGPQITSAAGHRHGPSNKRLASSKPHLVTETRQPVWPTAGPQTVREPLVPARKSRCHHPMTPALTCGNSVAGDGFEPS